MKVKIDKAEVDKIFAEETHQADVVAKLYRLVFKDWDRIESVRQWPRCSRETGQYIGSKFMDFDIAHHPKVMRGGLWMSCGFSTLDTESVGPWEVVYDEAAVEYKAEEAGENGKV